MPTSFCLMVVATMFLYTEEQKAFLKDHPQMILSKDGPVVRLEAGSALLGHRLEIRVARGTWSKTEKGETEMDETIHDESFSIYAVPVEGTTIWLREQDFQYFMLLDQGIVLQTKWQERCVFGALISLACTMMWLWLQYRWRPRVPQTRDQREQANTKSLILSTAIASCLFPLLHWMIPHGENITFIIAATTVLVGWLPTMAWNIFRQN